MKKSIKIIWALTVCLLFGSGQLQAKNFWNTGLLELIKDAKIKKASKKQSQESTMQALELATSEDGKTFTMKELLEMGIILTPAMVEQLENMDVNISSKLECPPFSYINDPAYEWSQFDNKFGKVVMTHEGLLIDSKSKNSAIITTAEFPLNPEDGAFEYGLFFTKTTAENGKYIGIVFDYESNKNYKAIVFSKKDYIFYEVEKGEQSVIKQGLVKPGKLITSLFIKYEGSKLEVLLNGLEVTTINRVSISSSQLGIIVSGKTKAQCEAFYFYIPESENDSEQSTSDL